MPSAGLGAPPAGPARRRRRRLPLRGLGTAVLVALVITLLASGCLAIQAVYFVGSSRAGSSRSTTESPSPAGEDRALPAGYVSGVSDAQPAPAQRSTVADQSLRSRDDADAYLRQLERGTVGR